MGTVQLSYPVQGSVRQDRLHVRCFTRHDRWLVERAWIEDEEMQIELQRRVNLDFLLNPDADILLDLERQRQSQAQTHKGQ